MASLKFCVENAVLKRDEFFVSIQLFFAYIYVVTNINSCFS